MKRSFPMPLSSIPARSESAGVRAGRRGFTVVEVVASLGSLAVALIVVAQFGVWSLQERLRNAQREDALEAAVNILEAARAAPWKSLDAKWAATRKPPEGLRGQLTAPRLAVTVAPEKKTPHLKRVTVRIQWDVEKDVAAAPVQLTTLISERSAALAGGAP